MTRSRQQKNPFLRWYLERAEKWQMDASRNLYRDELEPLFFKTLRTRDGLVTFVPLYLLSEGDGHCTVEGIGLFRGCTRYVPVEISVQDTIEAGVIPGQTTIQERIQETV
jgi:hypothetical protein